MLWHMNIPIILTAEQVWLSWQKYTVHSTHKSLRHGPSSSHQYHRANFWQCTSWWSAHQKSDFWIGPPQSWNNFLGVEKEKTSLKCHHFIRNGRTLIWTCLSNLNPLKQITCWVSPFSEAPFTFRMTSPTFILPQSEAGWPGNSFFTRTTLESSWPERGFSSREKLNPRPELLFTSFTS